MYITPKVDRQAKVNYYSDQKQALSKQEEYEAEEVGILENSLPTVENLLKRLLNLNVRLVMEIKI